MATSAKQSKAGVVRKGKKRKHVFLRKVGAGISLLALAVMLVSGFIAGIPLLTTAFRGAIAVSGVLLVGRVLLSVLSNYEDIERGKA